MAHSERARPSRNSSTSLGCLAISPPRTATPRQRQHALPSQAEFILCEQTIYAWFSVGMGATALTHSAEMFGLWRFITGLGVGALVATTGALVNEYAPPGKKNLINAVTYSGVPIGSLMAALLAIILLDLIR